MDNTELRQRLLAVLLDGHAAQNDAVTRDALLADQYISFLLSKLVERVAQKLTQPESGSEEKQPPCETAAVAMASSDESAIAADHDAPTMQAAQTAKLPTAHEFTWLPLAFNFAELINGLAVTKPDMAIETADESDSADTTVDTDNRVNADNGAQMSSVTGTDFNAESGSAQPQTPDLLQNIDKVQPAGHLPSAPLPLRPGQVPAAAMIAPHAPVPPLPRAKIALPNARAGTPFSARVEVRLDNGEAVTVEDVTFPGDIGLSFDKASGVLSGTPTASGDIALLVHWRWRDRPPYPQEQLFIINPNPRSLWKIIEPPADDRYFKSNVDHQQIIESGTRIAAASRRGRSHEHVGSFRDDDFAIHHCNESGWSIMLVADGAGSAKNSRRGSQIVTRCVNDRLVALLSGEQGQVLSQQVQNWSSEDRQAVGAAFIRQFHQASIGAVNAITSEAAQLNESVKSYSTTLLATVSLRCGDELFAAAFWMGDGAIAAYGPAGKVRVLGTPDSGEYAGQTRFLDAEAVADTEFSKRISIGKWPEISHLLLLTDGVSDPWFETDNGLRHAEKWDALVAEIAPCLADEQRAAERLAEWLNFFSPGNHDDRTIAACW